MILRFRYDWYAIFGTLLVLLYSCQPKEDYSSNIQEIDKLFGDWSSDSPGGAVAVISSGDVLYEAYFGLAQLDLNESFNQNTITDLGSISKQFTACLIALLEEQEKLSIEDNIRKYLPELPAYADSIRIKHLLYHTSGIKDYEALIIIQGQYYFEDHVTNQYVIDLASQQQTPNFPPNAEYEYSNTNYILLAEIIERVTSSDLNDIAREMIFEPLDMHNTFFHIDQGNDFKNRAIGYESMGGRYQRPIYRSHLVGDGGLYTNLADMMKWDANFYHNRLGEGNQSLLDRMKYREPLTNGRMINMAFAQIFTQHHYGQNSWSHGGSGGGYRSFYVRYEDPQLSVIVLTNCDDKNAFVKANEIAAIFFENNLTENQQKRQEEEEEEEEEEEATQYIEITPKMIEQMEGYYHDIEGLDILNIAYENSNAHFVVRWLENNDAGYISKPLDNQTLAEVDDSDYTYRLNQANGVLTHIDNSGPVKSWNRIAKPKSPIQDFAGTYYSAEVDHELTCTIEGNSLDCKNTFLESLERIGDLKFIDGESLAVVTFTTVDGRIDGFRIDVPRGDRSLRNLQFQKYH